MKFLPSSRIYFFLSCLLFALSSMLLMANHGAPFINLYTQIYKYIVISLFAASSINLLFYKYLAKHDISLLLSLILISTFSTILFIEVFFAVFPQILPLNVFNFYRSQCYESNRKSTFEFLNTPPYVKFKPHVVATSQGQTDYFGPGFVRKWTTDSLGFKNPDELTQNKHLIDVLCLGDSFTEGMGVRIDQAWPYLLRPEYSAYNFGTH